MPPFIKSIEAIERKVAAGDRLDRDDGLALFRHHNLPELGALADTVRIARHGEGRVTYVTGRNINYTNVCWVRCKFCAFYRPPGSSEGYVLSHEEIFKKIEELVAIGGTEVLMQGGLNPKLLPDYFEDLFTQIKKRYPVHLHALSPAEIRYIAHLGRMNLEECLRRLRAAGLDTIPGGGAEILVDAVRDEIAPLKGSSEDWLEVMRVAHRLGMRTSATMMYGSVDRSEDRVDHLLRIRDLQDETGGFLAFIPWSCQPEGTEMSTPKTTGYDYLRTVAVSRLLLDNIDNFQASWVTQGGKIAQVALRFGLNDFGSVMMEENVVSAAGTTFRMDRDEMMRLIEDAGFEAVRRNTLYEIPGDTPHIPEHGTHLSRSVPLATPS